MRDPTRRRSPGSWPRDQPVRWRALGRSLSTFVLTTVAVVVQFALVVPLLVYGMSPEGRAAGGGWVRLALTLVWGGATLWAAWSWLMAEPRAVLAPFATGAAIWLAWAVS
jgi:hypothetical protein